MPCYLQKIHLMRKREEASHECGFRPIAESFVRFVAAVLRRGNSSRIVVRSETGVVIDTSVTAGVIAAMALPRLTLLGTMAVLLSPWEVEIDKPEDLRE